MFWIVSRLTSKKEAFDRIKVTFTLGEESYRSDMSAPAIVNVIELAKGFYEEGVAVLPTLQAQVLYI